VVFDHAPLCRPWPHHRRQRAGRHRRDDHGRRRSRSCNPNARRTQTGGYASSIAAPAAMPRGPLRQASC
jgi:hypothetical protein